MAGALRSTLRQDRRLLRQQQRDHRALEQRELAARLRPRRGGSRTDSTLRSYSDADPKRTLNLLLPYLMQALIWMGSAEAEELFTGQVIEFVRLKRESELELKKRRMPEKRSPQEEPPPPGLDLARPLRPDQNLDAMSIALRQQVDIGGGLDPRMVASNQDIVPIVRVDPFTEGALPGHFDRLQPRRTYGIHHS